MVKIVSVKFKNGGKTYYFQPGNDTYEKGMGVIVETAKGLEYATVEQPSGEVDESQLVTPLKPVVRIATKHDEEVVERNKSRRRESMRTAQEKVNARGLEMKIVDCEFAFDGSKVTFFFTAETRVDFRELIKDLSSAFHLRIELRQISAREHITLIGGIAPCGRECCCIGAMPEPKKASVKMAKNQGLSLNPTKISGLCGRLMCCLSYEDYYYAEVCKRVPKLGSEVDTPDGRGLVVNVNMLQMAVKVRIEKGDAVTYNDYSVDKIRFKRGNVIIDNLEEDEEELKQAGEHAEDAPDKSQPAAARGDRQKNDRRDRRSDRREGKKSDKPRDQQGEGKKNNQRPQGGQGEGKNRDNQRPQGGQGNFKKPGDRGGENQNGNFRNKQGDRNAEGAPQGEHRSGRQRHRHKNAGEPKNNA